MKRSICITEPPSCLAYECRTFKFLYTPATNLPKGARLRFDINSRGRPSDWEAPQTNLKTKQNLIWAELTEGKQIAAKEVEKPAQETTPFYEFILPSELKAGETFTIFMGSPLKEANSGNCSQKMVQRRRSFNLFIDPKGKTDFKEHEVFNIDVRGNKLTQIRVLSPSLVARNKRFDVIVRFEDEFGNLTNNAPEGTLIELSYENLRENLNWKLFVPETGFINLPNLYFNEPNVYKIQLKNLKTGETFFSAPIKCLPESEVSLYWGLLHGESEKFDATENIEPCLRHLRDEKGLQFYASSPFESAEETPADAWKLISQHLSEFNEDSRFTTFLGFQFVGEGKEEGVCQILYAKEGKPILRKKDAKTNSLKKLYKSVSSKDLIAIPSFTMAKGFETDFSAFDPEFERVVEIYNAWGSSECLAKEGNLKPIHASSKSGVAESELGSVVNALRKNCRFGFVAGGLDDRGIYSGLYDSNQTQYTPGLTAILAASQTREALFEALKKRSCYATTGARIILGFAIAGASMGSELSVKSKPGLALNRHISGYVAGTTPVKEVTILRNGTPLKTLHPKDYHFDFTYDDMEDLSKSLLPSLGDRPPFVFYYLRVVQEDGHIAWSSPIWIDYPGGTDSPAPKKNLKKKGT